MTISLVKRTAQINGNEMIFFFSGSILSFYDPRDTYSLEFRMFLLYLWVSSGFSNTSYKHVGFRCECFLGFLFFIIL